MSHKNTSAGPRLSDAHTLTDALDSIVARKNCVGQWVRLWHKVAHGHEKWR